MMPMLDCELVIPIGTSTFTWMKRTDPSWYAPADWVPQGSNLGKDGAGEPNRVAWRHKLQDFLGPETRTNAEIDSTRAWRRRYGRERSPRRAHLIVSDTAPARWVAELMKGVLPVAVAIEEVAVVEVEGLNPDSMHVGLRSFVHKATDVVLGIKSRGRIPVLNATPGFKPESGLLTLIAAVLEAEVFYMHEQMNSVIVIPPLRLCWNLQDEDVRVLHRLGSAATLDQAAEAGLEQRLWPFFEREEGVYGLSAVGQLVVDTTPQGDPAPPDREGECTIDLSEGEAGHRPPGSEAIARRIAAALPFARIVRVGGWTAEGRPAHQVGLVRAQPEDVDKKLVRLRMRAGDDRLMHFLVFTTARDENEWRGARRLAGQAMGRVDLAAEIAEGQTDAAPVADDLDRWRTFEEVIRRADQRTLEAEQKAVGMRDALEHGQQVARKLQKLQEEMSRKDDALSTKNREIRDLQSQLDERGRALSESKREMKELQTKLDKLQGNLEEREKGVAGASRPKEEGT
jgi:putative CRISPR-associated protein (TIGR02619 family)